MVTDTPVDFLRNPIIEAAVAKTIRGATTLKLVPEQYVEINEEDAKRYGLEDGEKIRVVTRRGSYEARISAGTKSMIRPARSEMPPGLLFSPWTLGGRQFRPDQKPLAGQCRESPCLGSGQRSGRL